MHKYYERDSSLSESDKSDANEILKYFAFGKLINHSSRSIVILQCWRDARDAFVVAKVLLCKVFRYNHREARVRGRFV